MTCIKCGLEINKAKDTCPRCGNILPKEEIIRKDIEDGSLDAWSETAATKYVPAQKNMPQIPIISSLVADHPGAWTYIGAIALRMVCYLIGCCIMLFTEYSMWKGFGLALNLLFATLALFLVAFPPENEDFYWFKPIGTIIILADCGITWLVLLGPIFIKLIEILISPFA